MSIICVPIPIDCLIQYISLALHLEHYITLRFFLTKRVH